MRVSFRSTARRKNNCNDVPILDCLSPVHHLQSSRRRPSFLTDRLRRPLVVLASGVATHHFVSLSHSTPLHSPSLTQSTAIALYLPLRLARSLFISLPSFGFTCFTLFVRFFYGRPFNALARTTAAAAPLRSILRARFRRLMNKTTRKGRARKSPFVKKSPKFGSEPA